MNTRDSRRTSLPAWRIALAFALVSVAGAASLSEPPRVVHGKVVKLGPGGSYQLFSGTLQVKLVNLQSPSHVLDLDVPLRRAGSNGEFSYRLEIDQETAPASDKLASTLAVGSGAARYAIQSATVNGHPASLLDPGQAAEISTSFANRGEELRIDFRTDIPTPDTDGDGLPDWWEQLYGLDPANGADALVDADGDGWSNLKEFQLSTDPQTANRAPVLQDSLLVVTAGGTAGVYLPVADADSTAANLKLTLLEGGAGLVWKRAGAGLALGNTFTYADILAGNISVEVAKTFIKDTVRFQLEDLTTAGVAPQEVAVVVEAFSPNKRWLADPAVWLDAGAVTQSAAVEEWTDRSTYRRDGYQPYPETRPLADGAGRLAFHASQFLYVDEREVDLGQFVALMAFELDAETESDQTLFSSSDLEVSIGGPQSGIHGRSLKVVQNGRTIFGPVVDPHKVVQLTLASSEGGAELRIPGMGRFSSRAAEDAPLSSFTTVGARQSFSSPVAENFFNGSLREVLIYDRPLSLGIQGQIEDYQLARWQGVRVWNHRSSTLPVLVTGAGGVRNTICGGEGNDHLAGAEQADILRGGVGNNRLTGKGGADHFLFSKTGGNDVITDFSAVTGDVIDLTELFAGKAGLPSQYVKLKTLVTRDANNIPRVDTRLELIYGGVGTTANQSITLEGVGLGSSDLARLVGEGTLKLGGPRYDSVIGLAISAADPASPGSPRKLTVSRSGNTSAAIQVPLSLGGTARVDADYQILGSQGTGAVRSVALARGATQAVFDILPAPDRNGLATSISITALPVAQVSDGGASLNAGLAGVSTLAIHAVRHIHSQPSLTGSVKVIRSGGLDQALAVPLVFGGTLVNGVNVQTLPASISFAAGQATSLLTVTPLGSAPAGTELPVLNIALAADPQRYGIGAAGQTSVLWVTEGGAEAALSFADWRNLHFPGNQNTALDSLDSDADGNSNLMEYLAGTDPTRADATASALSIVSVAGGLELRWTSIRALTDVQLGIEECTSLDQWVDSPVITAEKRESLPDGRIRHRYLFTADPAVRSRFFRLRPALVQSLVTGEHIPFR
jgi:hypothetical protein